jgi:hypothetical protein
MQGLLWTRTKNTNPAGPAVDKNKEHRSSRAYSGQELRTQIMQGLLWTRTKKTNHAGPAVDKN